MDVGVGAGVPDWNRYDGMGVAAGGIGVTVGVVGSGKAVGIHSSACHEGAEDGADGVVGSGKAVGSHADVGSLVGTAVGVEAGGAGVPVGTTVGVADAPVGTTAIGSDAGAAIGWALSQATDAMASAAAMMASAYFRADTADRRAPLSACSKTVKIFVPSSLGAKITVDRAKLSMAT